MHTNPTLHAHAVAFVLMVPPDYAKFVVTMNVAYIITVSVAQQAAPNAAPDWSAERRILALRRTPIVVYDVLKANRCDRKSCLVALLFGL